MKNTTEKLKSELKLELRENVGVIVTHSEIPGWFILQDCSNNYQPGKIGFNNTEEQCEEAVAFYEGLSERLEELGIDESANSALSDLIEKAEQMLLDAGRGVGGEKLKFVVKREENMIDENGVELEEDSEEFENYLEADEEHLYLRIEGIKSEILIFKPDGTQCDELGVDLNRYN